MTRSSDTCDTMADFNITSHSALGMLNETDDATKNYTFMTFSEEESDEEPPGHLQPEITKEKESVVSKTNPPDIEHEIYQEDVAISQNTAATTPTTNNTAFDFSMLGAMSGDINDDNDQEDEDEDEDSNNGDCDEEMESEVESFDDEDSVSAFEENVESFEDEDSVGAFEENIESFEDEDSVGAFE